MMKFKRSIALFLTAIMTVTGFSVSASDGLNHTVAKTKKNYVGSGSVFSSLSFPTTERLIETKNNTTLGGNPGKKHCGVDVKIGSGIPVKSISAGTITKIYTTSGEGLQHVIVKLNESDSTREYYALYMHIIPDSNLPGEGKAIGKDTLIGVTATEAQMNKKYSPHLHFSIIDSETWYGTSTLSDPLYGYYRADSAVKWGNDLDYVSEITEGARNLSFMSYVYSAGSRSAVNTVKFYYKKSGGSWQSFDITATSGSNYKSTVSGYTTNPSGSGSTFYAKYTIDTSAAPINLAKGQYIDWYVAVKRDSTDTSCTVYPINLTSNTTTISWPPSTGSNPPGSLTGSFKRKS